MVDYERISSLLQEDVDNDIIEESLANEINDLAYDVFTEAEKDKKELDPKEIASTAAGAIAVGATLGVYITGKLKKMKGYENNPELKKIKNKVDGIISGLKDIKSNLSSEYWSDWSAYSNLSVAAKDHQKYYNTSSSNLSINGQNVYSSYNVHKNAQFDWERGEKEKELLKKYAGSMNKLSDSKDKVKGYIKELKAIAKECDKLAKQGNASGESIKAIENKLHKLEAKMVFKGIV